MMQKRFFSLKWKFALTFGSVFLLLLGVFSYQFYLDTMNDFAKARKKVASEHINTSRALIKKSFTNLGQSVELFFIGKQSESIEDEIGFIEQNLAQWLLSGGIENVIFFDLQGQIIKRWESDLAPSAAKVQDAIKNEMPSYQIDCSKACFQHAITPVLLKGKLAGALSVSRSFADILIEYKHITQTEGGILVTTQNGESPYQFSGMTNLPLGKKLLAKAWNSHSFEKLLEGPHIIDLAGRSYELKIFPINIDMANDGSFFVVIDDISNEINELDLNLRLIALFGIANFMLSSLLLLAIVIISLRRIEKLSAALPLLANQQYSEFREKITEHPRFSFGYDELKHLNDTALTVTEQLETLEAQVQEHTAQLLEKSAELARERDFVQQLIEIAPIIIIIQSLDGEILLINKSGIQELELPKDKIIGKKFDSFIPTIEVEHLRKLNHLRQSNVLALFEIDGVLLTEQGNCHISWLHTVIQGDSEHQQRLLLSIGVNISERKRAEEEIIKMATEDPLTGLFNRRMFQIELENRINSAKRYGFSIALFYLDLDLFKIINDTSGHEAGDKLLIQVTHILKKSLRSTDLLSRIGGDEFTIVVQNNDIERVKTVAVKINQMLSELEYSFNDRIYKVSVSIGIAVYPQHGSNVNELLANADLAMYQAKDLGGGQFHIFSPDIEYHARLTQMQHWKDIIESALVENRFLLFYQPILDLRSNRISHYECLIRMENRDGTLTMPDEFIGFAEELGLIDKIDRWVIKTAVQRLLKFKQENKDYKLAINLSGSSFNDENIFEAIAQQLLAHPQIEARQIIFEITETSAVSNFLAAQSLINKIKQLGCSLALDDFGVGFSSFYYLKHLPVDYVKIDGSFIRQIDKNDEDRIFVKALTEVSQNLGKEIVAEFVENEAIMDILKEFGIEFAQGYHIGKPQSLD